MKFSDNLKFDLFYIYLYLCNRNTSSYSGVLILQRSLYSSEYTVKDVRRQVLSVSLRIMLAYLNL